MRVEQLELNFEPGLTQQYDTLLEVIQAVVGSHGLRKTLAADLDIQPSVFSRMLNAEDSSVHFPAHKLPRLIEITGDLRPIYWLVEKFCEDPQVKQRRALAELPKALEQIQSLLRQVTV